MKYLNYTGLSYFWGKIKAWCNATFAAITHSHAWSTITSKPTTLSGYGITDAKIANGTVTLGSNSITPLTSHQDISGKVNKSGDTMTGDLTITNSNILKFKHTGITRGTAPSTNAYPFFVVFKDNADKTLGGLYYEYFTNKSAKTHLMCYQGTTNVSTWNSIGVGYDASGNVYTWAPTPATADNSTKIATAAFVKAQGYITGSGNTTGSSGSCTGNAATATKLAAARSLWGNAFDGSSDVDGAIIATTACAIKNNSLVKGTAPSSTQYITLNLCDKNGRDFGPNALGQLETRIDSDNIVHTYIRALKNEANSTASCEIACVYDTNNNTAYTRAPTPAASDNSTKIATTNWVAKADCVVHKTGAETIYGSKTFIDPINGWILLRDNNIPANAAPASNINHTILGIANAGGAWINEVYTVAFANGNNKTTMRAWNKTSTGAIEWNAMWNDAANTGYCWGNLYKDMVFINPYISRGSTTSSDQWWSAYFAGADGRDVGGLWGVLNTNQRFTTQLRSYRNDGSNAYSQIWLYFDVNGASAAGVSADTFRPQMGTFAALGGAGDARWGQIYSTSSAISTSDERQKCDVAEIPDEVLDAWAGCSFYQYRMKDRVAEKGAGARLHTGMIAQRLDEKFRGAGEALDRYGLFCHDSWDASEATFDEAGGVVDSAVEAGDEYSIRYEEALCMEAAWQRRENARLKKRIADLEERLAALELKVS